MQDPYGRENQIRTGHEPTEEHLWLGKSKIPHTGSCRPLNRGPRFCARWVAGQPTALSSCFVSSHVEHLAVSVSRRSMDFRVGIPSHAPPPLAPLQLQDTRRTAVAHRSKRLKLSGPATCQAADLALGGVLSASTPRKVAIFVEPSPFSHVSGMKIRFTNLIKGLRDIGDDVCVFTPCVDPPKTFHGAKVGVRLLETHSVRMPA